MRSRSNSEAITVSESPRIDQPVRPVDSVLVELQLLRPVKLRVGEQVERKLGFPLLLYGTNNGLRGDALMDVNTHRVDHNIVGLRLARPEQLRRNSRVTGLICGDGMVEPNSRGLLGLIDRQPGFRVI